MRRLLPLILLALSLPSLAQQKHTFAVSPQGFTLDNKPFKVLSGELHYTRIPREYWRLRLRMARAMGLNTIATYVFWNAHQPTPNAYDFARNNDLAAFIRTAQQEGLFVILRAGPYACAEWELGGYPSWLLATPASAAALRSNDPLFMQPAERWIHRLGQEVASLQVANGGPIILTQIENEYGNFGADHIYTEHLHQIFLQSGFTGSVLYTADNWRNIPNGVIPGVFAATNFGIANSQLGMESMLKARPTQPVFVSEYWPGWFDHWGGRHETRPIPPQLQDLNHILTNGAGINIYMFQGGTSFGFMAGSSAANRAFSPGVTSYDYDAPLDEAGHPTPKFFAYRDALKQYATTPIPPVPATPRVIAIAPFNVARTESIFYALPTPIPSATIQPMEHFGQSFGYILYRTHIPATQGELVLDEVHDYAKVFINQSLVGTLDRNLKQSKLSIATTAPATLDILVENSGRINSTKAMRTETKGITREVTLSGKPLGGWQIFPLPPEFLNAPKTAPHTTEMTPGVPAFYHATFTVKEPGDTFLDTSKLGKGSLWINGHAIGRYWSIGPQLTLYVPGAWLHKGKNDITLFDLFATAQSLEVSGQTKPDLTGKTTDTSPQQQQ